MGNSTSCFSARSGKAKLIDMHRDVIFLVDAPVTALELMIEEPGLVVSRLADLRCDRRISAMKSDEILSDGGVYVLIPASRVDGEVLPIEIRCIESVCGKRGLNRAQQHSSKVMPVAANQDGLSAAESGGKTVIRPRRRRRQWKPALETICESS